MDIEKVIEAKEGLEKKIEDMLKEFEKKTHLKIEYINIDERILYYGEGMSEMGGVKINVKL